MKLRQIIAVLLPIILTACGTGVDLESTKDHPGHPEAEAAETLRTGTLAIPDEGGAPETMAGEAEGAGEAAGQPTLYTCPMHPEIVRSEPGSCPICGMTLVPRTAAPESDAAAEEDPHAQH